MYLILAISPPLPVFLEKEMATHSSTIAWKIPWIEEPGRLQCMGSQRVGHNWATSLSFPCVLRAWSLLSRGIHMATSEIHWDSKETFCLALPTLREISHEGSPPIRVLCHLNLLFTFLYYFWNKLSTFCEGYVLGTFLWWHLLLFLVWVGLHCSSSLLHRAAL